MIMMTATANMKIYSKNNASKIVTLAMMIITISFSCVHDQVTYFNYIYTLEVQDHKKNRPLELLIVNPY